MKRTTFKLGIPNEGFVKNLDLSVPTVLGVTNKIWKDGREHDLIRTQMTPVEAGEERIIFMSDDTAADPHKEFPGPLTEVDGLYSFTPGYAFSCKDNVWSAEEVSND